jgi:hypothetical protein
MAPTWLAQASQMVRMVRIDTSRSRRRHASFRVEGLESRLSLSVAGGTARPVLLNPQPLPPGIVVALLNPQPLPPRMHPALLNPQPLPPGIIVGLLNPQPLPPGVPEPLLNPQPLPPGHSAI